MHRVRSSQVEVHLFRRRARRVEFLALRRTPERLTLPGVWQPVTGGRRRGEGALACAAREVFEETGLRPRRWWALETVTVYFRADRQAIEMVPLFAAEIGPRERVALSKEHDAAAFLTAREAGRRYLWEAQVRALAAVRSQVLAGGRLARALEVTPRRAASRKRTTTTRRPRG